MALCVGGCLGLVVLQRLRNFCLLQSNILLKTQRWYCIVRRALDAWECWWWELGGGLFPESPALSLRPSSIHPHSGTHPRSHNHEKHRKKDTECNSDAFRGRKHRIELFSGPQATEIFRANRASHIKSVTQKLFLPRFAPPPDAIRPQLGALAQFPVPTQKCGFSSFRALLVCAF